MEARAAAEIISGDDAVDRVFAFVADREDGDDVEVVTEDEAEDASPLVDPEDGVELCGSVVAVEVVARVSPLVVGNDVAVEEVAPPPPSTRLQLISLTEVASCLVHIRLSAASPIRLGARPSSEVGAAADREREAIEAKSAKRVVERYNILNFKN